MFTRSYQLQALASTCMISIFLVKYMNRITLVLPTWPRLFLHLGCFCLGYILYIYIYIYIYIYVCMYVCMYVDFALYIMTQIVRLVTVMYLLATVSNVNEK